MKISVIDDFLDRYRNKIAAGLALAGALGSFVSANSLIQGKTIDRIIAQNVPFTLAEHLHDNNQPFEINASYPLGVPECYRLEVGTGENRKVMHHIFNHPSENRNIVFETYQGRVYVKDGKIQAIDPLVDNSI